MQTPPRQKHMEITGKNRLTLGVSLLEQPIPFSLDFYIDPLEGCSNPLYDWSTKDKYKG